MEGYPPMREIPAEPVVKRYKIGWRVILIFNFALGAYMFVQGARREKAKEKTQAPPVVAPTPPTATTVPSYEEPAFSPAPVIMRQPILEEQQRELFNWMLEEKRRIKPQNLQEKKTIDEDKAILKHFIRLKSVPSF